MNDYVFNPGFIFLFSVPIALILPLVWRRIFLVVVPILVLFYIDSQNLRNQILDNQSNYYKKISSFFKLFNSEDINFSNNKDQLHQALLELIDFLDRHLRLKLHPVKCRIHQVKECIGFLGFRIFPTHR